MRIKEANPQDASTGHKFFNFISFYFSSRRWAHIERLAEMNMIAIIVTFTLLESSIANASMIATWGEGYASATTAWLNAIETSPSRAGAGVFLLHHGW